MVIPYVSVIIPVFNRGSLLGDAIRSCLLAFNSPGALEIIVVDDGSTDHTAAIARSFTEKVQYIALDRNYGRNRARNAGLGAAAGRYVKFLDSDDLLEPCSLKAEFEEAETSGADIIISGWQCVELVQVSKPSVICRFDAPLMDPIIDSLLAGRAVPTSAALYSRSLVADLRWDEQLRKLDDWDWFIRAALRADRIARLPIVSYSWRQHPAQGIRSDTMLRNAREHHAILYKLEDYLRTSGRLTPGRSKRLAQYFYKELRVLALHEDDGFEQGVRHIYELDPRFVPRDEERQWWIAWLCRILGVRKALFLHSAVKKAITHGGRDENGVEPK